MNPIVGEYYSSVGSFVYRQIIDNLGDDTMAIDNSGITLKHDNTIYYYDFHDKELSVMDNVNRVDYFLDQRAIEILYQELPEEKYRLFEQEAFSRI